MLEGLHDADLLAHPPGVVADRAAEDAIGQLELLADGGATDRRPARERGEVVEEAQARQPVVERDPARQVAAPPADGDAVADDVEPEHTPSPGGRVQVPQQEADQGRLARPVGPQEPEDLALPHVQGHVLEGVHAPVVLGQALHRDRAHGRKATPGGMRARSGAWPHPR